MKKLLCGSLAWAAIIAAAPAMAADMPIKAPPVAVASWSGLYVGLGVGFRSTETDVTVTSITNTIGGVVTSGFAQCTAAVPCVFGEPFNGTAFRFSPYVGYNLQIAPQWVAGIEGDWGWASRTTTLGGMIYPFTGFMNGNANNSFSVKTTWDASVRGRLGYLVTPSILLYATGGAAWLHVESTSTCHAAAPGTCQPAGFSPAVITHSKTQPGWTIGGGIEAMLWPNWIARAEYRYADFGTISNTDTRACPAPCIFGNGAARTTVTLYDVDVRTHMATFGLAYKFGGGDPVVAAGMPVKAPVYKAPPAAVASWTGFYVGLGVGLRSSETDATVTSAVVNRSIGDPINFFAGCSVTLSCVFGEPLNDTAFRFSPYVGYNWQIASQWVAGIEGDWGWARRTTTLGGMRYPAGPLFSASALESFAVKTAWDASVRGRLGYLVTPSVLLYVTGGAAWLHVESTSTCDVNDNCPAGTFVPFVISHAKNQIGWIIGGGLEAMLWANWTARAEYRYADFGTIHNTDVRTCVTFILCTPDLNQTVSYDVKVRTHTAMLGLAYKFDWAGPVVAKY